MIKVILLGEVIESKRRDIREDGRHAPLIQTIALEQDLLSIVNTDGDAWRLVWDNVDGRMIPSMVADDV